MGGATMSGFFQNTFWTGQLVYILYNVDILLKLGVANPFQEASAKAFGYVIFCLPVSQSQT